jgi:hypothetical protein
LKLASEKILVVEDEGIVLLHIKKTLERLGYVVSGIASTGEDAIVRAAEDRPDLVLMDVVLEGAAAAGHKRQEIINLGQSSGDLRHYGLQFILTGHRPSHSPKSTGQGLHPKYWTHLNNPHHADQFRKRIYGRNICQEYVWNNSDLSQKSDLNHIKEI